MFQRREVSKLALPNDEHIPTAFGKFRLNTRISRDVGRKLGQPEFLS